MKETFYFSHDYGARCDEKIIKLISKEGWEGYGLFWAIVEKLYEADGWLSKDYEAIAFDLRTECPRIARVVEDYNLFTVASEKFHSKSILARLARRKGISEQARQNANLRWNKLKSDNAPAMPPQCEPNAVKNSKGKESKLKDSSASLMHEEDFNAFYTAYPKKKDKTKAKAKFLKLDKSLLPIILTAIEKQRETEQWKKDKGQFVPLPSTWIHNKRWEDEITQNTGSDNEMEAYARELVQKYGHDIAFDKFCSKYPKMGEDADVFKVKHIINF